MRSIRFFSSHLASKIPVKLESLPLNQIPLSQRSLNQLSSIGIKSLFPIQSATFNAIMEGNDVIGKARTGTGKTMAFVLPIAEVLYKTENHSRYPKALIMCPTRELANQVGKEVVRLAPSLRTLTCFGGSAMFPQKQALERGIDVLVGTPGRLIDLADQGYIDFQDIKMVCLDEADFMLDIGFAADIDTILDRIRHNQNIEKSKSSAHQTLLFSATMPEGIKRVIARYLKPNAVTIDLIEKDRSQSTEKLEYIAIPCKKELHNSLLVDLLNLQQLSDDPKAASTLMIKGSRTTAEPKMMVFANTKVEVTEIAEYLKNNAPFANSRKMTAAALHGDISQEHRSRALAEFHNGRLNNIVCTDVAARGLDIKNVDVVVHMGLPQSIEQFLHRSGRTARAGKEGRCLIFYDPRTELRTLSQFEQEAKLKISRQPAPSIENIRNLFLTNILNRIEKSDASSISIYRDHANLLLSKISNPVDAISSLLSVVDTTNNSSSKVSGFGRSIMTGDPRRLSVLVTFPSENKLSRSWLYRVENIISIIEKSSLGTIEKPVWNLVDGKGFVVDIRNENGIFEKISEKWDSQMKIICSNYGISSLLIPKIELLNGSYIPEVFVSQTRRDNNAKGFDQRNRGGNFNGRRGNYLDSKTFDRRSNKFDSPKFRSGYGTRNSNTSSFGEKSGFNQWIGRKGN